jgi:hypothetical protein
VAGVLHKTNFMYVVMFYVWISVCRGGRRWAAPGPLLGLSWAGLGRLLGRSWAAPGLSWGFLGRPWAPSGVLDRVWAPARVLLLAAPGCSWALLAAPGCSLAARGRSWRVLAAPVCSWALLVALTRSPSPRPRSGCDLVAFLAVGSRDRQIPYTNICAYAFSLCNILYINIIKLWDILPTNFCCYHPCVIIQVHILFGIYYT